MEHHLIHQKVASLIPRQGTYLGFRFDPWQPTNVSLSFLKKKKKVHKHPQVRIILQKVKGLRSTDWQLQNSQVDVQYSIGIIANNVTTMHGAWWVPVIGK